MTSQAEQYRAKVAECYRMADRTTNPVLKAKLMDIAKQWLALAERAEEKDVSNDEQ